MPATRGRWESDRPQGREEVKKKKHTEAFWCFECIALKEPLKHQLIEMTLQKWPKSVSS